VTVDGLNQFVVAHGVGFGQALERRRAIGLMADMQHAQSKCLNREEFVVVGWTDPEGSRSHIGALLLGYYTDDGRLHYAGRAGTGMTEKELKRLAAVLAPLQVPKMPLAEPPPRDSRFGSPLKLSRVHWVRPELVVEVTYLTWTEDNLLRQVWGQAPVTTDDNADAD
jgi:ATP-dependent DNA ligase